MSRQNEAAPVVIKRKKVSAPHGHHGGAWKVAYADFVTAMMAFFLMMWLLGATTESQRRGLADYFNPTIPIHRMASGGDGLLGGDEQARRDNLGPDRTQLDDIPERGVEGLAQTETLEEIARRLRGLGGESMVMTEALRHIVTRVTDKGLVIEVFDLPDSPLFEPDTSDPRPILRVISGLLVQVMAMVANPASVEGHTRSYTVVQRDDPRWSLSMARAERMRRLMEEAGLDGARLARVTGHADRRLAVRNPMASRNNRLEVILLRDPR